MKLKENIAISDSGFVFDPSSGDSYTLNDMGKEIIMLMNRGLSKEKITEAIMEEYDTDKLTFERYFIDFVNLLRQFNLIED